jgi:hypothetical protein
LVGWGLDIADAISPTGYPEESVQKIELFKRQRMLPGDSYPSRKSLPLPQRKSEINAGAAYLFQIHMAMKSQLSKTLGEVSTTEEGGILYSFTVP